MTEILSLSDLQKIDHQSSDLRITIAELQDWDEITRSLLKEAPLKRRGDTYRLYAYLYCAQKAFADNAFAITGDYSGSIGPISLSVLNLFYPEYKNDIIKKDLFSERLSKVIMSRVESRYDEEEKQIRPMQPPSKEGYWKSENPVGLHYPSMKPWIIKNLEAFRSPAPPLQSDPFWKEQLKKMKAQKEVATETQKQKSLFWERLVDPEAADWRFIAVRYMNRESIPLEMQLEVRSKMMMALIDALIVVFQDKYTYLVRRPFMIDSDMKTLFATPSHPSYPAAHGTLSSVAETVLCYYFSENETQWHQLAYDARESRLWGGIHFPVDLEAGKNQGQKVGNAVIFQ